MGNKLEHEARVETWLRHTMETDKFEELRRNYQQMPAQEKVKVIAKCNRIMLNSKEATQKIVGDQCREIQSLTEEFQGLKMDLKESKQELAQRKLKAQGIEEETKKQPCIHCGKVPYLTKYCQECFGAKHAEEEKE